MKGKVKRRENYTHLMHRLIFRTFSFLQNYSHQFNRIADTCLSFHQMLFQALKIYTIARCTYKDYSQLSGVAPLLDLEPTIRRDNLPVPPSKNETAIPKGKAVQGVYPRLSR